MADGLLNKASIILTPTGYKAGTLYNVAPIDEPYEDFDFARASVASRVNSSGLVEMVGRTLGSELVTNGNFSNGLNNWTTNTATESGGVVTIPNNGYIFQTINFPDSGTIKIQVEGSGTVKYRLGVTSPSNTFITKTLPFTAYEDLNSTDVRIQLNNTSGSDITVTSVSVKEVIDTNNIPRISYDSNGDNGHILLEPTSTNLITYSEDFSQSSWINTYTLTPNSIISPDGSLNAYTITLPSVNGNLRTNVSVSSSTDYIFSFYAKRGTASEMKYRVFDFTNLSDIVSKTSYYSQTDINNWVRIEVPFTTNATTSEVGVYIDSDSQGNGDFYAWGAQVEELPYATSYIPTLTGSQETRATETATGAGSADLINSTEGVLYAEIAALDDSSISIGICDGSTDNRVLILLQSNNTIRGFVESSDTIVFDEIYQVSSTLDYHKVAIKYKANDFALWIDGVERDTDTNGASPIGLNELLFNNGGGGSIFYGKCKALAVFNEALSDSELTQLTT